MGGSLRGLAIGSGRKGSVGRDSGGDQWRAAREIGPGTRCFYWRMESGRSTLFAPTRGEGLVGDPDAGGSTVFSVAGVAGARAAGLGLPALEAAGAAPWAPGAAASFPISFGGAFARGGRSGHALGYLPRGGVGGAPHGPG